MSIDCGPQASRIALKNSADTFTRRSVATSAIVPSGRVMSNDYRISPRKGHKYILQPIHQYRPPYFRCSCESGPARAPPLVRPCLPSSALPAATIASQLPRPARAPSAAAERRGFSVFSSFAERFGKRQQLLNSGHVLNRADRPARALFRAHRARPDDQRRDRDFLAVAHSFDLAQADRLQLLQARRVFRPADAPTRKSPSIAYSLASRSSSLHGAALASQTRRARVAALRQNSPCLPDSVTASPAASPPPRRRPTPACSRARPSNPSRPT